VDRDNKAYQCPQDPDKQTTADLHRPPFGLVPGFRADTILCAAMTSLCAK